MPLLRSKSLALTAKKMSDAMPPAGQRSDWRDDLNKISQRMNVPPQDRWRAQVAINCFRQGSPPQDDIQDFTVGLTDVLPIFERELGRSRDGGCCLTLIHGPYGAGKSHSLLVLRDRAFRQGFLVSTLTLTQRECPLSDLGVVYSHIVRSIQGCDASGVRSIHDILEDWTQVIRKDGQASWEKAKRRIRQLHPDFQRVLAHYVDSSSSDKTVLAERWITGVDTTKSTANRLQVGLRPINEHGLAMIKELGVLARSIGFRGLVMLLDEAEAIPSYSRSSDRALCYENLCQLISPKLRLPGCYFVYATTPAFFERTEGLPLSRNSRQVVTLRLLMEHEAKQLGKLIRDLYIIGESIITLHASIDDLQVDKCVRHYLASSGTGLRPRAFVRSLVGSLDIWSQNPRRKLAEVFAGCDYD